MMMSETQEQIFFFCLSVYTPDFLHLSTNAGRRPLLINEWQGCIVRPGSLSRVALDSKCQSHAAHAVTDTADIGPDACAPGVVVTRNQEHDSCFMALQLKMAQNDACFCTRGRLHQVIYFLYPGVQPAISGYSNITPLPCQLLIVQVWKQHFAEWSCIWRRVKRKVFSTPTSYQDPLFPGCEVVIKF